MGDLKNRVRIGNSVDKKIFDNFKKTSDITKISMSKLLDEALEYINKKYATK